HNEQGHKSDEPNEEIDQALEPAVPGPVHLTDVEHERHSLELGDGQLAEPLVVEQRQGAYADAALVQCGRLVHDGVVALSGTVEYHDGRPHVIDGVDERVL